MAAFNRLAVRPCICTEASEALSPKPETKSSPKERGQRRTTASDVTPEEPDPPQMLTELIPIFLIQAVGLMNAPKVLKFGIAFMKSNVATLLSLLLLALIPLFGQNPQPYPFAQYPAPAPCKGKPAPPKNRFGLPVYRLNPRSRSARSCFINKTWSPTSASIAARSFINSMLRSLSAALVLVSSAILRFR